MPDLFKSSRGPGFSGWVRLALFLGLCASVACSRGSETTDGMLAVRDSSGDRLLVLDEGQEVLTYNYGIVEPGALLEQISPENRKYAQARSNYIHPLRGFDGEALTLDWPVDHPHHRGIYWAWPKVKHLAELGDLHALQRVFARPTGRTNLVSGDTYAQIEAENVWKWEDKATIVQEVAIIRAWRTEARGRLIDLEFHFSALQEGVSLARRGTDAYGGLNIRLAEVRGQQIRFHTDAEDQLPRMAWAELSGQFSRGRNPLGISVFQHPSNPEYPGDWVEYPELNWFQPTFPTAGSRYPLTLGHPLVLRFRLWIHRDRVSDEAQAEVWKSFAETQAIGTSW